MVGEWVSKCVTNGKVPSATNCCISIRKGNFPTEVQRRLQLPVSGSSARSTRHMYESVAKAMPHLQAAHRCGHHHISVVAGARHDGLQQREVAHDSVPADADRFSFARLGVTAPV